MATERQPVRGAATHVRWRVVASVFVLAFITIVDRVCISAAKAEMSRDLGISNLTFGMVFGAFALGYGVLMVPSGWLADRWGPRRFLTLIVSLWSIFTALTGLVNRVGPLVAVRFAFGLAEAGAYPTAGRAIYNWCPARERGLALGLLHAGSRVGAAFGLAVMSLSVVHFGWRMSFYLLGTIGFLWASYWYLWFRDDPRDKASVSAAELKLIENGRGAQPLKPRQGTNWRLFFASRNVYLILGQYFASNFTFFLCFTWLLPYIQDRYGLPPTEAGLYASVPLYCGAFATWIGGVFVDAIYRRGRWRMSRALPAAAGFGISAASLIGAGYMTRPAAFTLCFALATLGVDLAISPSWSVCADVGREYTGTLSGAMNMVGSLGSFTSSIAFPYLLGVTGSVHSYLYTAAALNLLAFACWLGIHPERALRSW
ncbi:MAG: MFS transporter [Acidobacteria bacterium]|nr:MFS transporter [Acidobacteriota bacterium]MBI3280101.1 MFS transporter [Acidobacteriota bacterium]